VPAIEIQDLTVRHGDLVAVDGVGLTAEAGATLALLGPNGAGKTTLIETLEGYRRPDGGFARVLGMDPFDQHDQLVGHIGVMLQNSGIQTGIRPVEAMQLYAALADDPLDPDELLDRVGLGNRARTPWRNLSGGEQRRLSLALALVGRPDVVFLDEPTAGVDAAGRKLIHEIVGELRAAGVCVLMTTHDLADAERLADYVVILDHGRIVAHDTPDALRRDISGDEIRFGAPPGLDLATASLGLNAPVTAVRPGEYRVAMAPSPANVAAVTQWLAANDIALADLQAGRQTLEDVFDRLTSEPTAAMPPDRRAQRSRGRRSRRRRASS
jgi:ABC-2 type transport system ATP-binding protein